MTPQALISFSSLCSAARQLATQDVRGVRERRAHTQALEAIDAAALAVLDLGVHTGHTKTRAFARAVSSLRPALLARFPAQQRGEFAINAADFSDLHLERDGTPAYWHALWAHNISLEPVLGALVTRALKRGEPDLIALLSEVIPATPSLKWLFHLSPHASRHAAFLETALTAAVQAHPEEGVRIARHVAQERSGFLVSLLLAAGVPLSALLSPNLPPRIDTALRRISAHQHLALCPQPGRITHLFSHTPTRQQAGKLLVG